MTEKGGRDKKSDAGSHRKRATSPKRNCRFGYGDVSMLRARVAKRDEFRHSRPASTNLALISLDFVERKLLGKVLLRGVARPRKLQMSDSKISFDTPSIPFFVHSAVGITVDLGRIRELGGFSS
jgi:hypothetical protein